ncbi:MAG: UDP-N-acetylmuramoyl-tripeptide--D-alanyl-D-alanine ligase [Elusimicrobia bacterium]|nr:UDP-N-acetylmuramoyl-tripeptide--D-alanyl-D-alanine ligase [Elusimicrobiota bacterium]
MNLDLTFEELARASGGRLLPPARPVPWTGTPQAPSGRVVSISTDSRTLAQGQVFWALKGARFDAHDFLTAEIASRSSGWVVAAGRLKSGPRPANVIEVSDTLKALLSLAAHHRRRFDLPVVGITGSNGKTTTKEMVRCICLRVGATCASVGNLNNQVGLPLSVLELTGQHRYGVFEMGASRPGDIAELGAVTQPTVGVLLNIGPAHLEFFGSLEGAFKAKSELIAAVPADGKVVVNTDDPWLAPLETGLGRRAVTFGLAPRSRVRIVPPDGLVIDRRKVRVRLDSFGDFNLANAAAAAAAAWAAGIDATAIVKGLEDFRPAPMRLERMKHPSGCEVVLDAYNANPASMKAAILAFCREFSSKAKVLVLGDMKELGPESPRLHEELGVWLAGLPLRSVYLAGPEMANAFKPLAAAGVTFRVRHANEPQSWLEELRCEFAPDAALFLKASRAMRFEDILDRFGRA